MRPRSTRLLAMLSVVVLAVVLPACSSSAALPIHYRDESDAIRITRVDALHFTSGRAGWAILTLASNGQQDVARTVNGGHLWILSRAFPTGVRAYLHVVSSNTVYVLLQSQTGQVTVLRTVNGGKTWLSVAIPTPGIDDSWTGSFGARSTSWLLSCAPPSLSGTQCKLFRTMHGGLHWQHLSSFPVVGLIPNGVTFIANDGWITGQNHSSNAAEVLSTRDEGRTWAPVPLILPTSAARNADTYPVTPRSKTLLLPAVLYEKDGAGFLLYQVVHGVFRPTAPLSTDASPTATSGPSTLRYSIVSRAVTYVLASPNLYRTANAGRSWEVVNARVPSWAIMAFVNPLVGYAVQLAGKHTHPILWTTTDGGGTWTHVLYKVTSPSKRPELAGAR